VAIEVAHQAAERSGDDRRYRAPQPEWLGGGVQRDHDADNNEGGKADGVEQFDQSGAEPSTRLQVFHEAARLKQ